MLQLKLDYDWKPVESEKDKPYKFPQDITEFFKRNSGPSVYQWRVHSQDDLWIYVGETSRLDRRIQGYLTPGPSQSTNIRVKESFGDFLKKGYDISLDSLLIRSMSLDDMTLGQSDLHSQEIRRAIENLLTFKYRASGIKLLNK